MNVIILDTETTGLHPSKGAVVIEVAALLYNVERKVVTQVISTFLPCMENPVEHINGINPEWTNVLFDYRVFLDVLCVMASSAEAIVAHNAQFDRIFMQTIIPHTEMLWALPWICTKNDFAWPVKMPRNRLQDVCDSMGVAYVDAHRALTDCNFIAACFNKVVDLEGRLINALRRK